MLLSKILTNWIFIDRLRVNSYSGEREKYGFFFTKQLSWR